MKLLFTTPITTERHKKLGFCESSDFATLQLLELDASEKKPLITFNDYKDVIELIEYNAYAYKKINSTTSFPFSREQDAVWLKKQGKFSEKVAIQLMLKIRERYESNYSHASGGTYILIGRTLYERYCPVSNLRITICGNLLFSCWLSINIEGAHGGKQNVILSKKNFERVLKEQTQRFEEAKPKKGTKRGDGHVDFSYPKNIKWGERYLKKNLVM